MDRTNNRVCHFIVLIFEMELVETHSDTNISVRSKPLVSVTDGLQDVNKAKAPTTGPEIDSSGGFNLRMHAPVSPPVWRLRDPDQINAPILFRYNYQLSNCLFKGQS